MNVAVVVVPPVCAVTKLAGVVTSWAMQTQPVVAVGNVTVPVLAVPPVPTFTVNADVPLWFATDGDVPKPETVGAVAETCKTPLTLYRVVADTAPVTARPAVVMSVTTPPSTTPLTVPVPFQYRPLPLLPAFNWLIMYPAAPGVPARLNSVVVVILPVFVMPVLNVCRPVKVCAASVRATLALVVGNVMVVLSVPASVNELLTVAVLPLAIVSVADVAGAVIVTLLTVVPVMVPPVILTFADLNSTVCADTRIGIAVNKASRNFFMIGLMLVWK